MKSVKTRGMTRERLLQAASKSFARHGYAGSSVDGIVSKAGVNKRMVYHYFGSKKGLYRAVWEEAFHELVGMEKEWLGESENFWELSEKMVRGNFRYLSRHPEFSRLLLWENLHGGENLADLGRSRERIPNIDRFDHALQQELQSHPWLKDWTGGEWIVHLIGLCQIYFSNQHTLSFSFGLDYRNPDALLRAEQQVLGLLQQIHGSGLAIP